MVEGTSPGESFLVLVTGHAAAGKTTVAEKLAEQLGAVWISRDAIHAMVYSGWSPQHPALTSSHYDPEVEGNTYFEGRVVWDVFLWMLTQVVPHHPVVADTPFNHAWNRDMFHAAAEAWDFPVVEVALDGDPRTLLARARLRAGRRDVHEIKARFSVRPERYARAYQPVLDDSRVLRIDTTDLGVVDPARLAEEIRALLLHGRAPVAPAPSRGHFTPTAVSSDHRSGTSAV